MRREYYKVVFLFCLENLIDLFQKLGSKDLDDKIFLTVHDAIQACK